MSIAIKKLDSTDISSFDNFLLTNRSALPKLKLSPLVPPHESITIIAEKKKKKNNNSLIAFAQEKHMMFTDCGHNVFTISSSRPVDAQNHSKYLFSGYTFYNGKMLIGLNEVSCHIKDTDALNETYGEFCMCTIKRGHIELTSDFFGMVPWFYYENNEVFAASNNYHMLLIILTQIGIKLTMNIARSRVNIITSGFTFGSAFSKDLDVDGCKMNLAYEKISYTPFRGTIISKTSLWDIISNNPKWNEDLYEEYIKNAKNEIESNCKAAFEHPKFTKIVIDISGGFDSRVVFAAASNLPKKLRSKIYTYTRKSGTSDDIQKASAITNIFNYPKHSYKNTDTSELFDESNEINLAHLSRTLGTFSVNSYMYTSKYDELDTLELTGGIGDIALGFQRIRGELDYSLGDTRLLARLGGCYLHNSVEELIPVFRDQEKIIFKTLKNYNFCDCLFKKFHMFYLDFRNRLNFGSAHNIENNNFRIPMVASKYALKAKLMYFNKFSNNTVPDEKISVDLISALNPVLSALPFASNNDNVLPKAENLLQPYKLNIEPDFNVTPNPKVENSNGLHKDKANKYMDNIDIAEQMLLHIYDYSDQYYPVCLGLYKVLQLFKSQPDDATSGHGRETIRKIYDIYYQIKTIEDTGAKTE